MKFCPFIFSFHDIIAGTGFFASVSIKGRVYTEVDENCTWMFGVQPGGIAAACQPSFLMTNYKESYLSVLYDIAAEVISFEDFKKEVILFFEEVNQPNLVEWNDALQSVRESVLNGTIERLEFDIVKSDDNCPKLEIKLLDLNNISPKLNTFDEIFEVI